jgi:trimeric autotransporter adhesin
VPGPRLRCSHLPLKQLERLCIVATCAFLWLSAGSAAAIAQAISRVPSINTIVGNGTAGYSGDGGPASSAELNSPYGVVADSAGNLYIADPANNRIRKVAVGTGIISTFAGTGAAGFSGDGGPATSAELNYPVGVALDIAGNLFIADQGNSVIRKVSLGTITTVAGNNEVGYSGDGGMATNATLYAPAGITLDNSENLYIADQGNSRIRLVNAAGTITTFAGNGTTGYTGDNGPVAAATLNKPSGVVEDGAGNLYIVDTGNNAIRKVTSTGTITTVVGNGTAGYTGDDGPAATATLNAPYGVNIDTAGNLYIADSKNNVVRMVTTAGVITTVAGDGTSGFSGDGGQPTSATLNNPQGVALDTQGNLYISDQANNRIREVSTPAGSVVFPSTQVTSTSTAVSIQLRVNEPGTTIMGIMAPVSQGATQEYTVTANGCALNTALDAGTLCNIMVTFAPAYPGLRPVPLQVVSSAGTFSFGLAGIGIAPQAALTPGLITTLSADFGSPNYLPSGGIAIDNVGNLYVAVSFINVSYQVFEVAAGTGALTTVAKLDALAPYSLGLALDSAGNLYIANPGLNCVSKLAAGSTVPTTVAGVCAAGYFEIDGGGYGGDNGLATNALLNTPTGVGVDSAGNLYIADTYNNRIRKVAVGSGIITTVVGNGTEGYSGDNGPATSAEMFQPNAVAVDSAGNLYIADAGNDRIRKATAATGIMTTVAGNGTDGYSGDGGPATDAELGRLQGVAVDSAGDFYIASNYTVRMVNTAGIITTVAGNNTQASTGDGGPATSASLTPGGVALDSAGNLYIPGEYGVRIVSASAGALNFPTAPIGSPSTTQAVAVTNIGNAPLSFAVPASGQNPSIPVGFTLDSSSSCPQPSLAPGASCTFAFDFVSGTSSVNGTASITDNALNANLTQTVQLSGGPGNTVATTTTVNVATPVYGQTQISATILATAGTVVPVGSVVFTVDGAVQPAVQVNSTGVATLPAAVSNPLAVGSHTIGASYTSSIGGFTNSIATRIFSVGPAPPPPSVTIAPNAPSLSVAPGSSVTDTLTITSVGGYAGSLQLSCSNLPQNATCSFQPATVTLSGTSGPQTAVVTIQTAGGTAALHRPISFTAQGSPARLAAAFWAPGLLVIALASRKRRMSAHWVVALALLAGTLVVSGCGGGGSSTASAPPNTPPSTPSTPAGSSTVQITASAAGNTVQSFALTLTVQ